MKKIITPVFCIITFFAYSQKQKSAEDKRFAGLDTAFARVMKDRHTTGFVVAVVEKDKIVYAQGNFQGNKEKIKFFLG